jgi:hypothetical protein
MVICQKEREIRSLNFSQNVLSGKSGAGKLSRCVFLGGNGNQMNGGITFDFLL